MPINSPNNLSRSPDSQDSVDIILKILNDNGIPETLEDIYQKFRKGEQSKSSVIGKISKKISSETISEDEIIALVEKQLNVNNDVAKNIIKNIKEKLSPLNKTTEKQLEAEPLAPIKKIEVKKTPKTGPDAYREPIE